MSFSDTFVEVDGCKTHLRRAGKGEPLLFLHGASGAPAIMPFMEKLAQRFDVLVPEHPGWGKSDEPAWLENIHDVAYFYLDFLKRLDLRNVTVVGSSMGGWIAMEMAVRDTARMKSLVLVSPAGIAAPGVLPADIFLMPPEDLIKNLFVDEKLVQARLSAPVKLIWGREDRILPVGFVEEYRRLLPRAQIKIVENCGHLPHAEKVDEFVDFV